MLVLELDESGVEVPGDLGGHSLGVGPGGVDSLVLAHGGGLGFQVAPVLDQAGAIPEPATHERPEQHEDCQGAVERRDGHAVL